MVRMIYILAILITNLCCYQSIEAAAVIDTPYVKWKGGIVFYEIDASFEQIDTLNNMISYYEQRTPLKFLPRTTESHYVIFTGGNACYASIGMPKDPFNAIFSSTCGWGHFLHEFGHLAGLFHEQARTDRDRHVTIFWRNIEDTYKSEFRKYTTLTTPGKDFGFYDFNSVMHYGSYTFSKNGGLVMQRLNGDEIIRNEIDLSITDRLAIYHLYQAYLDQNCSPLDATNVYIQKVGAKHQLKHGDVKMASFYNKKNAQQALRIVTRYDFKHQCTIGSGSSAITFFKQGNKKVPSGTLVADEVCDYFENEGLDVRIKNKSNLTIYSSDDDELYSFKTDIDSAYTAYRAMKDLKVKKRCHVGNDQNKFTYWKK